MASTALRALTFFALSEVSWANLYKFGVFSDIHLLLDYQPNLSPEQYCVPNSSGSDIVLPTNAYFGRFGCDVPETLVRAAMQKMLNENPDLDFLLIPGDFIGHGLTIDFKDDADITFKASQARYERLKNTQVHVTALLNEYFPNVPVVMSLGNNDAKYHYQPPFGLNEQGYYHLLFEEWFSQHPGNQGLNLAEIKSTTAQGGWYRAELIPGELTVLCFNSLQFNKKNQEVSVEEKQDQLAWLEAQLSQAGPSEKFFLLMHIYATAGWWLQPYLNWIQDQY